MTFHSINFSPDNPCFDRKMLRFFLRARVQVNMDENGITKEAAKRAVARVVALETDITVDDVRRGMHGEYIGPVVRTKIWAVLGHDPGSYGIRLLDGGGQEALNA